MDVFFTWHELPVLFELKGTLLQAEVLVGVGDVPVTDAVAVLESARASTGETFVVESGRDRYLFTFSATGVRRFVSYAL